MLESYDKRFVHTLHGDRRHLERRTVSDYVSDSKPVPLLYKFMRIIFDLECVYSIFTVIFVVYVVHLSVTRESCVMLEQHSGQI